MKLSWTRAALRQLTEAYDYIQIDQPSAAARMADLIETTAIRLRFFPQMGRPSLRPKTRELAIAGTPFVLVYRAQDETFKILAMYHSAKLERSG